MFDGEIEGRRKRRPDDPGIFLPLFPSETRGDGRLVANNLRTGAGQGRGSNRRKVRCLQCGFLADLNRKTNDGGDPEGNDYRIAKSAPSGTSPSGLTISDILGDSSNKRGCGNCGSRNFAEDRPPEDREDRLVRRILEVTYGY